LLAVYVGLSSFGGTALAFADVAKVLNEVRSATWKTTSEVQGLRNETVRYLGGEVTSTQAMTDAKGADNKPAKSEVEQPERAAVKMTGVGMFRAPSHERMESTVQDVKTIQIVDGQKDKAITLIPATKTALVVELKNLPPDKENPFGKTFQGLRELVVQAQQGKAKKIERLIAKTIDGRPAEGFRLEWGAMQIEIWADAETSLPVRVEQHTTSGAKVHVVMSDFETNVDLDESLFSLDVPKDYTIQQTLQLDLSKNPIYYLADTLKLAAELNDGVFPSTLRGKEGIDGILSDPKKLMGKFAAEAGKVSPEHMRKLSTDLAMNLGATFGFLSALSPENHEWHYAGKDVRLNAPDTPIFWYRLKSAATYHILYADLSIQEVPSEKMPKVPQSDVSPKP
jgi:outer membrane lipoprotein-sorting protein